VSVVLKHKPRNFLTTYYSKLMKFVFVLVQTPSHQYIQQTETTLLYYFSLNIPWNLASSRSRQIIRKKGAKDWVGLKILYFLQKEGTNYQALCNCLVSIISIIIKVCVQAIFKPELESSCILGISLHYKYKEYCL
jgi:hypothetical protein